jgi:protein-S-isoprenylcysteine O-methyltransferase Ste14
MSTATLQSAPIASTLAGRIATLTYGGVVYSMFLVVYLYAIAFISGVGSAPFTVDSTGHEASTGMALLLNTALLGVFALQHSIMARRGFKAWWTKIIPKQIERSTYVLASNIALVLLYTQWRPLPGVVWHVEGVGATILTAGCFAGFGIVLISTFLIDHFDLFGLRQVITYARKGTFEPPKFRTPLFYKAVRHPIYLGFTIAFWCTPHMSIGHLLFAVGTTGFVLIAIQLEERDMIHFVGKEYEDYKKRVPMIIPGLPMKRSTDS